MKSCIVYFSQTGNTKMFAEAISRALDIADVYDMTTTEPSTINEYDMIILGTPVHGFNPSKESISFIESLPETEEKEAILFITCRLWKGGTIGKLKKELKKKGYRTGLCVDAKAKEFTEEDFAGAINKLKKELKK
jgi:flavodoxin